MSLISTKKQTVLPGYCRLSPERLITPCGAGTAGRFTVLAKLSVFNIITDFNNF
jgi:hypothetical protein